MTFQAAFERKIVSGDTLLSAARALARPVVMTNGVFDILHRGHATYLAQARALGASLVVALNSDSSVRSLGKGDDRPINTEADRAALLAALESVTLVTVFAESVPLRPLEIVRPDIYVKGGDYAIETLPEAKLAAQWGAKCVAIPILHDRSPTRTLQRIRSLKNG